MSTNNTWLSLLRAADPPIADQETRRRAQEAGSYGTLVTPIDLDKFSSRWPHRVLAEDFNTQIKLARRLSHVDQRKEEVVPVWRLASYEDFVSWAEDNHLDPDSEDAWLQYEGLCVEADSLETPGALIQAGLLVERFLASSGSTDGVVTHTQGIIGKIADSWAFMAWCLATTIRSSGSGDGWLFVWAPGIPLLFESHCGIMREEGIPGLQVDFLRVGDRMLRSAMNLALGIGAGCGTGGRLGLFVADLYENAIAIVHREAFGYWYAINVDEDGYHPIVTPDVIDMDARQVGWEKGALTLGTLDLVEGWMPRPSQGFRKGFQS